MKILKRNDVSEEIYLKTWELDNITFEEADKIEKNKALEWFYASGKRIIVVYDEEKEEVMGYLSYFLLKPTFSAKYINTNKSFQKISAKNFTTEKSEKTDLYIFSTVIQKQYRDIKINGEKIFKIINNEFLKDILEIYRNGTKINYVYAESVSKDGEKYLESLNMKPCFYYETDRKYVRKFDIDMFEKCSNFKEVKKEYAKITKQISVKKPDFTGHEYLSVKDNVLYYKNINLYELVKKYDAPLEVAYLDMIPEKINNFNRLFTESIQKNKYFGSYNYAYATKANYYCEVVSTVCKHVKFLETSSPYDIGIILKLLELGIIDNSYTIICNGFKTEKYIGKIKKLLKNNIKVIPIIENYKELHMLIDSNVKMDVGIRYNSDFDAKLIKNNFKAEDELDNRFGFEEKEVFEVAKIIKKSSNLNLKVFHFHFGGVITDINNYMKGYANIFHVYTKLKTKYPELKYFDFGGGVPVKYSLDYTFDYEKLIENIIVTTKELSDKAGIEHPDLIGEHGRYTVADHSFSLYKVDFVKNDDKLWYILNTSIMNMTPDVWAIQQEFSILPVNMWNKKFGSVFLGGETCDPDDRYYLNNENVGVQLPIVKDDDDLYIAVFSMGAYQENISGIGGVHHCMIPEGAEIIIGYNEKKTLKVNGVQTQEEMLELLGYNDERILKLVK